MKRLALTALLSALVLLPSVSASAETLPIPGYDRMDVPARHRAQPIAASLWYPAGRATYRNVIGDSVLFEGAPAMVGAAVAEGRYPLILLSHGSGGAMDGLVWLSSRLAARGAVVLAVNHPGTTSGDSSPRRTMRLAPRAADLGAALEAVLGDPEFSPHIDRERISAVGFSLGGTTVLGLAGLRFDREVFADYCRQAGDEAPGCDFLAKGGVRLDALPEAFSADMRDLRVSAVVSVDPGFTHAVAEDSLAGVRAQVLFLNMGEKNRWPAVDVGRNGSGLAARLPGARQVAVAPAHHFTFLGVCKEGGAEMLRKWQDDPICDDPQGTDRAKAHEEIVGIVAEFLGLESGN
ncbi:alpha/beta hydrolase family protein [Stappia indica]|uniref:alpha/beta hydrolase family protein n=1 Tax=Stappia indica TaxID=538381 RepID=UPI00082F9956|nr:alpha/beta fold hydrolase [Stappia indica]